MRFKPRHLWIEMAERSARHVKITYYSYLFSYLIQRQHRIIMLFH